MKEELFTCVRDGLTIRGKMYVPDKADGEKLPAIIFSHGFNGNYSNMEPYCKAFADMGYACFCLSFCGGSADGTPKELISDGSSIDMNVFTERDDLITVFDYVCTLSFVDTDRIVLSGNSQGGFVSGLAAAKLKERVWKLIMIYPALCIPDHARRGILGGASYSVENVPDTFRCAFTTLGKQFHEMASTMDPYMELEPFKGPVLILQGDMDNVVNFSYAIKAKEHYGAGQCHLQMIHGMGHGEDDGMRGSQIASMRQFLNGRKEIMTVRVFVTHTEGEMDGDVFVNKVYFTGFSEGENFRGAILPGAVDTQRYKDDKQLSLCADYTLDGLDKEGKHCRVHIVNQKGEVDFEPKIDTDSETLSWLNTEKLTAVLEFDMRGLTVRIFAGNEEV